MLSRKNRVSVRGDAIKKLWEFCVSTVSTMSSKCWRIVIGKLGRLSHGEIRGKCFLSKIPPSFNVYHGLIITCFSQIGQNV